MIDFELTDNELEYELEYLVDTITLRIFIIHRRKIEKTIKEHPDKWENESHFIRCAIMNYLKKEALNEEE